MTKDMNSIRQVKDTLLITAVALITWWKPTALSGLAFWPCSKWPGRSEWHWIYVTRWSQMDNAVHRLKSVQPITLH